MNQLCLLTGCDGLKAQPGTGAKAGNKGIPDSLRKQEIENINFHSSGNPGFHDNLTVGFTLIRYASILNGYIYKGYIYIYTFIYTIAKLYWLQYNYKL